MNFECKKIALVLGTLGSLSLSPWSKVVLMERWHAVHVAKADLVHVLVTLLNFLLGDLEYYSVSCSSLVGYASFPNNRKST